MFAKIKKSLGFGKEKEERSYRLGGGDGGGTRTDGHPTSSLGQAMGSANEGEYDLLFYEERIGLEVDSFGKGIVVSHLLPGKEAILKGVKEGDMVIALEGNEVNSPESFVGFMSGLGRPVNLRFKRLFKMGEDKQLPGNPSQPASVFNRVGGNQSSSSQSPRGESMEERRARMAQAAKAREGNNKWDKQSKAGRSRSVEMDVDTSEHVDYSDETRRVVQSAKGREAQMIRELGYNPFVPVMASTNKSGSAAASGMNSATTANDPNNRAPASSSAAAPTPAATSQTVTRQGEPWTDLHQELVESLCDEALAMLLSVSGGEVGDETGNTSGQELVTLCIATTTKMLENIKNNPKEQKFRSIRVQNPNFNAKVYSIPGGKQLFTAAGFQLHTSLQADGATEESYLKHDMTYIKTKMLVYVVERLKELQQGS